MKSYIQTLEDLEKIYQQGQTISIGRLDADGDNESSGDHSRGSVLTSDRGKAQEDVLGELQAQWWMSVLTRRQQRVITVVMRHRKRRLASEELNISLQAVHQIIIRIRRRIEMYQAMREN